MEAYRSLSVLRGISEYVRMKSFQCFDAGF
jgi:hypothetical protein